MSFEDHSNPFVGLRPFESDESLLFFGRKEQTIELLQCLHLNHFVAIVGGSGCGKSSLVKAGLIPKLKGGYLIFDSDIWNIISMRPGLSSIYNLATSIFKEFYLDNNDPKEIAAFARQIREGGADVIINKIISISEGNKFNVLLFVDQFEEIFHLLDKNNLQYRDEAVDFVNILLELTQQTRVSLYVTTTLRSDYIGDCSQFYGLPDAMNKSQYLVPRLNRIQLKNVIEGPIKLYGVSIDQGLSSKLLNEIFSIQDELPLLQHALMRLWDFNKNTGVPHNLNIEDYDSIGGIKNALSKHAEEALIGMTDNELLITKQIFQALTSVDQYGRKIKQRRKLSDLIKITGSSRETILAIVDRFIENKRSFLIKYFIEEENDIVIDISHESLIRQWDKLSKWAEEESENSRIYLRLTESAKLYSENKKDLTSGNELTQFRLWYDQKLPTKAWSIIYNDDYEKSINYLKESQNESIRLKKRKKRFLRVQQLLVLIGLIVLVIMIIQLGNNVKINRINKNLNDLKESFRLSLLAKDWESKDPSIALRLAEEAIHFQNAGSTDSMIAAQGNEIFWNNIFYKTLIKDKNLGSKALFSPDGKFILTNSLDSILRLWTKDGKMFKEFDRHAPAITSFIAWSPKGDYIVCSYLNNKVVIWDINDNSKIELKHPPMPVTALSISKSSDTIILGSGYGILSFYNKTGQPIKTNFTHISQVFSIEDSNSAMGNTTIKTLNKSILTSSSINAIEISQDGSLLVYGCQDGDINLINFKTGKSRQILPPSKKSITALAMSPDMNTIAIGSNDNIIRLLNLKSNILTEYKGHISSITSIAFSPDGNTFISGSTDKTCILWSTSSPIILDHLMGHTASIRSVSYSYDGRSILTGSDDKSVKLWELRNDLFRDFKDIKYDSSNDVHAVSLSKNSKWIATGSLDGKIRIYGVDGKINKTLDGHSGQIYSISFSPDSKWILAGFKDSIAIMWNIVENYQKTKFIGHSSAVNSVTFSSTGDTILTGSSDHTAKIWRKDGSEIPLKMKHKKEVTAVAFSPSGDSVLTGSSDRIVRLWDLTNNMKMTEFKGHTSPIYSVAYSPDGKYFLSGALNRAFLWSMSDTSVFQSSFPDISGRVLSVAFSPDSKSVLIASNANIALWSVEGPKLIKEFRGHTDYVNSVAFSISGDSIVSGSNDGVAKLWNAKYFWLTDNQKLYYFLKNRQIDTLSEEKKIEFKIRNQKSIK